ncbi:MAG: C-GCAxxG-C-C family protein, partial [Desulfobulbaceae bacterium]|nr:C-GCAxxG-C-C family protein [Desulfobulbaceae bacterium]
GLGVEALKMSAAFGGGMGIEDKCGALTAGLMVLSHVLTETVAHQSPALRLATNEFLKQVPLLKARNRKNLLICATNHIRQLDAALLRPGRFDCIIPVGGLDELGRKTWTLTESEPL